MRGCGGVSPGVCWWRRVMMAHFFPDGIVTAARVTELEEYLCSSIVEARGKDCMVPTQRTDYNYSFDFYYCLNQNPS